MGEQRGLHARSEMGNRQWEVHTHCTGNALLCRLVFCVAFSALKCTVNNTARMHAYHLAFGKVSLNVSENKTAFVCRFKCFPPTQAYSYSYSASDMCGSPAIDFGYRDPGLLHRAKLTGLQPGSTYYYTCGDDQFGWSQEFSFKAASPADPKATVKISAFGGVL